jgi:adenylate kinase
VRIVLLGPPGAGKGTQAHRLADRYGIALIATGDIFRDNVENDTDLGREATAYMEQGELVPDEVVVRMVLDRLSEPDAEPGFILDGFPRTLGQALALEDALTNQHRPLNAALRFVIQDELAVKRLAGRGICRRCQRSYNVEFHPPRVEGVCDVCGGELFHRQDDEETTVRHRIEVYHRDTEPLVDFFRDRGILREVDADGFEDEVTDRAIAAIDELVATP